MPESSNPPIREDPVETRIIKQAELLDAIVSSMAQGVLAIDAEGLVVATNLRFQSMLDFPSELCVPGTHFLELARYSAAHGHYGPGDPELLAQDRWRAVSAHNDHYRASTISQTGLLIEVEGRTMPGGGFVNTYTDVTESLAREAALRETEARFRLIAEESSDVVNLVDDKGVISYMSPASERVLGWKPAELCGRIAIDFVHPEDQHLVLGSMSLTARGAPETVTIFRHLRPDGSWIWIESRARRPRASNAGGPRAAIVVLRDASERKQAEQALQTALERAEQLATTDGLTGLANRRQFDQSVDDEWRRCSRRKLPLSILMIDVDYFKLFNDHYGHLAGDDCLRAVASEIGTVARRPGDLAARYGGEEFVLLMPGTPQDGALHIANQLRTSIANLKILHQGNEAAGVVTVSIGVATCSPDYTGNSCLSLEAFLSLADQTLYQAKEEGRNSVVVAKLV